MANDSRRMGGPRDSDRRSDPAASGIAARSRSSRCVLIIALPAGFIFIAMAHYAFLKGVGKQHNIDRALARATLESISQIEALRFPMRYVEILDTNPATTHALDWSRSVQFAMTLVLAGFDMILFFMRLDII